MENRNIDSGRPFDWGMTSENYGKYRDIYPQVMYDKLRHMGVGLPGQRIIDLGTGTGVLPRAMYRGGAVLTGIDITPNQIEMAKRLAETSGMDIDFRLAPVEELPFADGEFQAATAAQCFVYFDHQRASREIARVLCRGGLFAVIYMGWLPEEDDICRMSEELILKYNPVWSGGGDTRRHTEIPQEYSERFDIEAEELFDVEIPFTRESWNGRIKTCRGIGASLSEKEIVQFESEHRRMLEETASEKFTVMHFASITILAKKRK